MDAKLRQLVRQRAGNRCEYCLLRQAAAPFMAFHVEHIRAQQHGGQSIPANLALSCPDCNAKKGPNIATVADSGELIPLFNPRQQSWQDHFAMVGFEIVGTTEIGRAKVQLLGMNDGERLAMRSQLSTEGLS